MERVVMVPSLTLLLLLLLSALNPSPSTATPVGNDLVETTCNRTGYNDICLKALRSDPRSPTADLRGLATIALDQLSKKANETLALAVKLQKEQTPGSRWYRVYGVCAKWHKRSIDGLIPLAIKEWAAGSHKALADAETAAVGAGICHQNIGTEESPLSPDNHEVFGLCYVAGEIIALAIQHLKLRKGIV